MEKNINILIFPAGTEIGLEIFDSLRDEKGMTIYGGSSSNDFSSLIYPKDRFCILPFVDSKTFISQTLKACKKRDIKMLFPAHDQVIKVLSENREIFEQKGILLVLHPGDTSSTCRSKLLTYNKLKGNPFVPRYVSYSRDSKPRFKGPYFLKPTVGQGSKGVLTANTFQEIKSLSNYHDFDGYIICEKLPGDEFTIDCFTDFTGKLIFCEGRLRAQTTNGISVATSRIKNAEFRIIALKIQKNIRMNGAWFFQLKEDKAGRLKLLEVGARIAGSSTYSRYCGTNLSMMNIFNLKNITVSTLPEENRITVKKRIKSYATFDYDFENVYVDLDDTLIVNQKINLKVINFLYWCLNHKKRIILITRHQFDLRKTLNHFKINQIFDEVIHIINGDSKCLFIKRKKSIFIDDSFAERLSVYKKRKIPVYSIQCLPDVY